MNEAVIKAAMMQMANKHIVNVIRYFDWEEDMVHSPFRFLIAVWDNFQGIFIDIAVEMRIWT